MPGSNRMQAAHLAGGEDTLSPRESAVCDIAMVETVATALAENRSILAYQPVMQADDPHKAAFYEGLARIMDESGRVIPAGAFLDAVEATSIGRDLDVRSLELGLRALEENPALRLSINLSARTIGHESWASTLDTWLERNDLIAERLILEITESSAIDNPDRLAAFMARYQRRGVCFAMDDFGAGYTALSFFKRFRFDMVKIDGQFIRGISHCPDNRAVTSALIALARHFDMLTVAEFVESEEDAATLAELGIDCLQGYFFSAPSVQPDWVRRAGLHEAV